VDHACTAATPVAGIASDRCATSIVIVHVPSAENSSNSGSNVACVGQCVREMVVGPSTGMLQGFTTLHALHGANSQLGSMPDHNQHSFDRVAPFWRELLCTTRATQLCL
jgi:hypothetical protein